MSLILYKGQSDLLLLDTPDIALICYDIIIIDNLYLIHDLCTNYL